KGIITGFYTNIDGFKLGYIGLRFLISFQYASESKRNEIINYFSQNKNTWYIAELEGTYDFVVNFWVKDIHSFHEFWDKTLKHYRNYFQNVHLSIYTKTYHYINSYLINKSLAEKERLDYEIINSGSPIGIEPFDASILQSLADNARIPLVEIARKLNISSTMVTYRINKLKKQNIIQGFRVNIDISKLGLKYFTVNFQLKDYNKRNKIIKYIKKNLHVKMIDTAIGTADVIVGLRSEDINRVHQFIKNVQKKYSDSIKKYDYFYFLKLEKINFLPDLSSLKQS
ncbi:MAG: Lrp/AsnC family transcriptional regulator, partial [Candidatus Thermoplasmatota archaeon]|nr:Lrp/AsnC family transcriptional regulator [Candidatus Thermoplasmatota archaeon]